MYRYVPILSRYIVFSTDFLGVNSYTSKMTYRDASLEGMYAVPSYMDDMGAVIVKDPTWPQGASIWLQVGFKNFTYLFSSLGPEFSGGCLAVV